MHKIINYILVGLLLVYIIVSFSLNFSNNDIPYIFVALILIIVSFIFEKRKSYKNWIFQIERPFLDGRAF